jgi:hypothetical protein
LPVLRPGMPALTSAFVIAALAVIVIAEVVRRLA